MNKIKLAIAFFAGLFLYSCSDSDEAVLYDNWDFISIKGDSVISSDGLQMVASTVDVYHTFDGAFSEINSQVTVGNNVFDLYLLVDGGKAGKYTDKLNADEPYGWIGYVKYRSMLKDSTFKTDRYAILSSEIDWTDVDNKTVLFDVNCKGKKMLNDSTLSKASIVINGKIRAIKQ